MYAVSEGSLSLISLSPTLLYCPKLSPLTSYPHYADSPALLQLSYHPPASSPSTFASLPSTSPDQPLPSCSLSATNTPQ
ncbi:hypothetical protein E2C01_096822 [Portunus trituberculatus]|uniref:Uncharacterized protein n=1 Tax=Portunus trituberculatus TaxID=210409 RepID=A0A5B7JTI5_PORTR|nr:hypothetical protein [Portunus trituberculatus]